jgi:glutamate-1-semialdehyde 2,1-aminomutase
MGVEPDIVTIGKAIAGGVPSGAYGVAAELAERISADADADLVDTGGVGGTLAGNALSLAATRATLEHVLTDEAFAGMTARAVRFTEGVQAAFDAHGLTWSISRLGARAEYLFASPPPRTGTTAAAGRDSELEDYLHVYLANRGVLITPFHNMALMSPDTTDADVDRHTELFGAALADLHS